MGSGREGGSCGEGGGGERREQEVEEGEEMKV